MRAFIARRRRHLAATIVLACIAAAFAAAIPGLAALAPSTFEGNDGNLISNGGKDWATLSPAPVQATDLPTGQSDNSFGQGTKEDTAVPSVVSGSIPNNKSDLSRFYLASETVSGTDFLYLAWSRVQDPTGTTNMDFELNQSAALSSNGVTPVRTAGDVLIKYDLAKGGTVPVIGIHRWVTSGNPNTVCEASSSVPCWGIGTTLNPASEEGAINGTSAADPLAATTLSARTFGEAAINLEASGIFDPAKCTNFGQAYLKSRSSDSFTSAVKDFIAPIPVTINSCPNAEIKLKKVDSRDPTNFLVATLQLFKDNNSNGVLDAGDTQVPPKGWTSGSLDCTTTASDGIGNCDFEVSTSGTYIAHESVPPTGFNAAADITQVVTIDKTLHQFTLTFTDTPAPGTLTVHKRDTGSPPGPLAGAHFTLYNDVNGNGTLELGTDTVRDSSCITPANGDCTYTGLPPGKYLVQETAAPPGYDLPATTVQAVTILVASGGDAESLTFSDPPTKGSISVVKRDAVTNAVLDGAHFTLWSDVNNNGTLEPATDVVLDSSCITGALGTCSYTNLVPGKYLVQETQAPPGYDLPATTVQAVTIAIVTGGDSKSLTFVDTLTPGSITVHKQDDDDTPAPLAGATFKLYKDDGTVPGSLDAGDTALGTCTTIANGDCTFANLAPGDYLVEETVAPDGYDLPAPADRVQAVQVVKATGGDAHTITFTDPRKFRVIVLVCKESSNALYPSAVTLDGVGPKTSIGAADLPPGVTEAQACSIGGARFSGKHHGSYDGNVTIPK